MSFITNGHKTLLHGLMKAFDEASPKNIRRFKGLGEMDGPSLNESTLSRENRTLVRYSVEDVKEVVENIRYYENNKDELLDGVEVSRFDVIG